MAPAQLTIRRADSTDAMELTELSVTTFQDTFGPPVNGQEDMDMYIAEAMSLEQLSKELSDAENLFFLACDSDVPVGYAKLRASKIPAGLESTRSIELERLYVRQAYLDKKVGAALMNHCLSYATDGAYEVMWLGVWEHNHRAMNFYRKYEFEVFGDHAFVLGNDRQRDLLMKKTL